MQDSHKTWLWIVVFFAVGATIGLIVAMLFVDKGVSAATAVAIGAFAGGYGASIAFMLGIRWIEFFRGRRGPK